MWFDYLAHHGRHSPQRLALVDQIANRRLDYQALDGEAWFWTSWLRTQGAKKGDRIALLATNRREHLTLFLACCRLGAILVPLNFRLAPAELECQLARIDARLLLVAEGFQQASARPSIRLDAIVPASAPPCQAHAVQEDDPQLILFTSGSSGAAKGVILHAGMLQWNAILTHAGWGLRPEDVSVVHTPFFHTGAYNVTCLPLLRLGGRLILTNGFAAQPMLDTLERERVTVFFAVPTMFQMLADCPGFQKTDLSALRFCISGGAPCPAHLIRQYRERGILLRQGFGLTEVGPNCFTMFDDDALERPESVGLPMPHSRVRLLDEQGQEVASGIGELCIAGPHLCSGYWNMPEAFSSVVRNGFFHTGDLMRRDAEGFYYVVGRKKEMYISGGENVYPGEVVRAILQHPAVEDAAVLPVPHPHWGEVGFAFVVARGPLSLEPLRDFLNPLISRYKHPHYLQVLPSFPLLPNGKVDRITLQAKAKEAAHGS